MLSRASFTVPGLLCVVCMCVLVRVACGPLPPTLPLVVLLEQALQHLYERRQLRGTREEDAEVERNIGAILARQVLTPLPLSALLVCSGLRRAGARGRATALVRVGGVLVAQAASKACSRDHVPAIR